MKYFNRNKNQKLILSFENCIELTRITFVRRNQKSRRKCLQISSLRITENKKLVVFTNKKHWNYEHQNENGGRGNLRKELPTFSINHEKTIFLLILLKK